MKEKKVLLRVRTTTMILLMVCLLGRFVSASENSGSVALFLNDPVYETKLSPIERSLAEQGIEYTIFNIFDDELPQNESQYSAVIIAGGDSMRNYIDWNNNIYQGGEIILRGEVPILGICLGHQIISRVFGSVLYYSEERRWHEVTFVKQDEIFDGFEDGLLVWENHAYAVASMPEEFEIYAKGNVTPLQMMKHKDKPIYGVQFHPETQGGFLNNPPGWKLIMNFAKIAGVNMSDPPLPEDGRVVYPY
ncbi:MAG: gamma-glutamyl-gamma-aminobutyrate hydrolase family protein [Kosmotogaceae bacterium]|nr:gamma-glutamyl-gamma-aminobutyrate hydrolase family protein [Kosmotogaceae bacterium]